MQVRGLDFRKSVSIPQNYIVGLQLPTLRTSQPRVRSGLGEFAIGHLFPLGFWHCKQGLTLGSSCGR